MDLEHSRADAPPAPISHRSDRRKNPRFGMNFAVLLRTIGDPWMSSQTVNLSTAGAAISTDRPFLLNTPVEYVLTFPPELTKASEPLLVRFFGMVLRCERGDETSGTFRIAVRSTAHRYLSHEEAAGFDAIAHNLPWQASSMEKAESIHEP